MPQEIPLKKLLPWILYLIFFAVLNETVFNASTPSIAAAFSLNASGVSWVMTTFLILFGIGSVVFGRLSDLYSLRTLITQGVVIYSLGSLLGFVGETSFPLVILARAIQGWGASALPALVFVIVARYYPEAERGGVFGLITSIVSVGLCLGPVLGSVIASWHWALLFLLPFPTLFALPFLRRILPQEARRPGRVDVLGAVLVALTVGSLVLWLNVGGTFFLYVVLGSTLALILATSFLREPFLDPALFREGKFLSAVLVGFSFFSIVMGVFFLVPLLLNTVHHTPQWEIGLLLLPGSIASMLLGPLAGKLADRRGNPLVFTLGAGLLLLGLLVLAEYFSWSPWLVSGTLILAYGGLALFQTALMNSVSTTLSPEDTGVGMGIFNLVSIISGAVGTALVGKIFEAQGQTVITPLILIFAGVVTAGVVLFLIVFRSRSGSPVNVTPN